jgi:CspA family cold shock protein
MPTGVVKWFDDQKGYGFIIPDDGERDLFVHVSGLEPPSKRLMEGTKVNYDVSEGRQGPNAVNVREV